MTTFMEEIDARARLELWASDSSHAKLVNDREKKTSKRVKYLRTV